MITSSMLFVIFEPLIPYDNVSVKEERRHMKSCSTHVAYGCAQLRVEYYKVPAVRLEA
jgi:hypothetical protein